MTNKKSTKRALLMSALSLLLCFSMLIGSTFAWFTDSVTSGRNKIVAGNLDVELYYKTDLADEWAPVDENTKLFDDNALYEPGFTQIVYLKAVNEGSLALKFQMATNIYAETAGVNVDGDKFMLSDYLKAGAVTTGNFPEAWMQYMPDLTKREDVKKWATGSLGETLQFKSGTSPAGNIYAHEHILYPADSGETQTELLMADAIYMPEEVGNEANHNGTAPSIELGLNLIATQFTYEEDSFDNQYDKDADYVAYFTAGTHELNTVLKATKATDVVTATGAETVVNINGGYYDAGDQDCAVWAKDGATVNIYGGTFTHNGDGTDATSAHHYDMIYAGANGGKINIYGGTYSAKSGGVWLLNEKDNQGEIVVYGGTFVNWNPADNVSEGKNTNFVAEGYVVLVTESGDDTLYTVVSKDALLTVADDGSLNFADDIAILDAPVYSNYTATEATTINGNGKTVTMIASDTQTFDWTENFTIPLMAMVFSSEDGALVTVNDLTITGEMQSVMAGNYESTNQGRHNTVFNNVNIIDAKVVSLSAGISPALSVYGKLEMNNCNVYGATLSPLDTDPMWPVYDVAVTNSSVTTVNGGKLGSVISWAKAKLMLVGAEVESITPNGDMNTSASYGIYIDENSSVGIIDLSKITNKAKININIEEGATIGKIVANGVEYASIADWKNA